MIIKVPNAGVPEIIGLWNYHAGASGTVPAFPVGKKSVIIGITCHATTAGSFTITPFLGISGDSIPVPANSAVEFRPGAQLYNTDSEPLTITFTGTDSWIVEFLT